MHGEHRIARFQAWECPEHKEERQEHPLAGARERCGKGSLPALVKATRETSHGVTLGQTHERSKHPGVPVIGDRVYIGCGAKILGGIKIGNDAVVAPNAVVVSDVPAGAVVEGIPACVLSIGGSDGYVSNVWPLQTSGDSEKKPPSIQVSEY